MRLSTVILLTALLPACSQATTDTAEVDLTGTTYYEMTSRLSPPDLGRWTTARAGLLHGFDDVCGDTFCEGDYSNLSHVALGCSITQAGYVKECTWVFAGSIEYVDGATGAYTVDARTFACTIPVKSKANAFLGALAAADPIRATLPATGQSFYDGLVTCFSGVVGNLPPEQTGTTYVELADWLGAHGDPMPWYGARRALPAAFEAVCGDTFCEGDYADLTGLRFVCATNDATGDVVGCRWTIAGANLNVTTKGHVSAKAKLFGCPVSVHGPAADVVTALSAADPLHAALPGSSSTLMDQLSACLP